MTAARRSLVRVAIIAAFGLFTAAATCGQDAQPAACPTQRGLPAQWTLRADGIEVVVHRAPYALSIGDGTRIVLASSDGALGWTRGTVSYRSHVSPGYTAFAADLEPWRDDLEVASAEVVDGALRVALARPGELDAGCVLAVHTVRPSALRVEARLDGETPRAWKAAFVSPADEGFLGLGERFNRTDQRGVDVYHWAEEGGIGAGEGKPLGPANPFPHGEAMTYYPVPFFVSTKGYGFWLDTTWRSEMNLATARPDAWRAWHVGPELAYEVYLPRPGDARPWPYHVIDAFTARTGRPMRPPAWAFGPRRRVDRGATQGGVSELQTMRARDLAVTSVDAATHFFPAASHRGHEAELRAWTAEAAALGYRVNGYYNAMVATRPDAGLAAEVARGRRDGRFLADPAGAPSQVWVLTGNRLEQLLVVDFTSPSAKAWYQGTFAWARELGYSGWMYDFGEYVQADVIAHDGTPGEALHNLYPVLQARAAAEALPDDVFRFMRAGYTGASAFTQMAWSGDPAASFETADGLPSMPRAAINLGVSGVPHWAGDIGGFHCIADGAAAADEELLTRWIQQGSTTSGMQDQDDCVGGDEAAKASLWNAPAAERAWRTYARLHTRLLPYLEALADDATATGAPVVRHVFLEHPDRVDLRAVDDAYYLGPALLVAPVVVRGAREKRVVLPAGTYMDWDTRAIVPGGQVAVLDAPLEKLPLLLRAGHLVPLLDPRIDTLADEDRADIVGPRDVADVYDVVGLLVADGTAASRAHVRLSGDGALSAEVAPGVPPRRLLRAAAPGQILDEAGVRLINGSTRTVRWDLVIAGTEAP